MADQREAVLNFVKLNGPILPVQLAKHLNTNILFASAMLSELVETKKMKMTSASIGGSPLYYLQGQEAKTDLRLSTSLGGREKQSYELIRDNKVLREKDLEPWQRIAIKNLKDFASPISVVIQGNNDVFWKYNLVNEEEAKIIIAEAINNIYPEQIKQENEITNQSPQTVQEIIAKEEPKIIEQAVLSIKEENSILQKTEAQQIQEDKVKSQELIKEVVKGLKEELFKDIKHKEPKQEKLRETNEEIKKLDGKFYEKVANMLKENGAEIIKEEMIKKDKEIDFLVNINTKLGKLRYYVKAKNKPAINEADISLAYSEGQLRKLPTLLIVNGKINKKATDLINNKLQGQLTINEL